MNSSFLNRISAASTSAARLIADAKTAAQLAGERVRTDHASAALMEMDRSSHSVVETAAKSVLPSSDSMNQNAAVMNVIPTAADDKGTEDNAISVEEDKGEIVATCAGILVNTTTTTANTATVTVDYMSRFRQIALLAAQATPVTSKMIAGHAQNVANSVAVAAKSAVDSVGARKSAIMNRQEARVCRSFYLFSL